MKPTIRTALPAAVSVALVAGAFAVPAIATTDDGSDTTASTVVTGHRHGPPLPHAGLHSLEDGELAERLAAELELGVDEVQAAIDTVRADLVEEGLAAAVEAGRLTPDEADRLLEALATGDLGEAFDEIRLEHLATRLAERVAAGELTQDEADELLEAARDGERPAMRRGPGRHAGAGPGRDDDAGADGTDGSGPDTRSDEESVDPTSA